MAALMALVGPESKLGKALSGGGAFRDADSFNTRPVHAAEIPAAGGIGDARSIARMYAACVGEVDGIRLLTAEQLEDATTQRSEGPDIVILDLDLQFGLGFNVPSSLLQLGGPSSFGHFGMGGSAGWADPEAELGFGYVMNKMELGLVGRPAQLRADQRLLRRDRVADPPRYFFFCVDERDRRFGRVHPERDALLQVERHATGVVRREPDRRRPDRSSARSRHRGARRRPHRRPPAPR